MNLGYGEVNATVWLDGERRSLPKFLCKDAEFYRDPNFPWHNKLRLGCDGFSCGSAELLANVSSGSIQCAIKHKIWSYFRNLEHDATIEPYFVGLLYGFGKQML